MLGFNSFKIINIISIDNFIDIDDILNCYYEIVLSAFH
jgi:hypothetical protein